jgi:hypothetical protein
VFLCCLPVLFFCFVFRCCVPVLCFCVAFLWCLSVLCFGVVFLSVLCSGVVFLCCLPVSSFLFCVPVLSSFLYCVPVLCFCVVFLCCLLSMGYHVSTNMNPVGARSHATIHLFCVIFNLFVECNDHGTSMRFFSNAAGKRSDLPTCTRI